MLIRDVRHENGIDSASGPVAGYVLRRDLRPGDPEAIVELHERLYTREHGMDHRFVDGVANGLSRAVGRGWPAEKEGAWIVERDGRVAGCVGLTYEVDGVGKLRWVLLDPALRGSGLGRRLISEAVAAARAAGILRLELDTFSDLRVAGRVYRSLGFRLLGEERTEMWGPPITFQRYALEL